MNCNHCTELLDNTNAYVKCTHCTLKYHYTCLVTSGILSIAFTNNNSVPKYVIQVFSSPNFKFLCPSCLDKPHTESTDHGNEINKESLKPIDTTITNLKIELSKLNSTCSDLVTSFNNIKSFDKTKTYSESLMSKSLVNQISKQITIDTNLKFNFIVFNIDSIEKLNVLLPQLNISLTTIDITKLNTKNITAFKVSFKLSSTPSIKDIMDKLFKLSKCTDDYSKVFIRPDENYDDRTRRLILNLGSKSFTNTVKCVFNYKSLTYELRYFNIVNDKSIINWNKPVSFHESDYDKWSNLYFKSINDNNKNKPQTSN